MSPFADFSGGREERLDKAIEKAEKKFAARIAAGESAGIGPLGLDFRTYEELREVPEKVNKPAALEYLGSLVFFFLREYSAEKLTGAALLGDMNLALGALRQVTLDHKWPPSMPLSPDTPERREREFDRALIDWLGARDEWQKYEAQIAAQVEVKIATTEPGDHIRTPLLYYDRWKLESLQDGATRRIRGGLLEIHGANLDRRLAHRECWLRAYDLVASEFDNAQMLSDDVLRQRIPHLVADAAEGAGWSPEPLGRASQTAIFSEPMGSCFYPSWRRFAFLDALQGRITHWTGRTLLGPPLIQLENGWRLKPPSRALVISRRKMLTDYQRTNDIDDRHVLARRLGVSETSLYGMIRGDRSRYKEDSLDAVLEKIGCPINTWFGVPTSGSNP